MIEQRQHQLDKATGEVQQLTEENKHVANEIKALKEELTEEKKRKEELTEENKQRQHQLDKATN